MKPSEIERVVSDWKLPQSSSNQKNRGIGGNVPSSTPLSPSLSQRKSMGVITQNKAPNTIASTPNSPITPKVEYSNVINYSDPKVIASAMKTKEIELQVNMAFQIYIFLQLIIFRRLLYGTGDIHRIGIAKMYAQCQKAYFCYSRVTR